MRRLPLLLLALLVLSGCGGNPLAAAVSKTTKAKGVRVSMDAKIRAQSTDMRMTGEGVMDMAGKRAHLNYRMTLPAALADQAGLGKDMEFEQIMVGLVMYMKLPPQAAKSMPGGKRWMKIDMAKAGKAMGVDMQSLMQGGGTDPSQSLKWLQESDDVEEVGDDEIDGVETTHYRADLTLDDLAQTVPAAQRDAVRKNVKRMRELGMGETLPMEVWVSDDDLVRRMRYAFEQEVPGAGKMKMDFTMNFTDYGTKVRIPQPPSDAFDATDLASQPTP